MYTTQRDISDALAGLGTVAVVGLSDDPTRPSYEVSASLQQFGLRVIPVNPNLDGPVLGEEPFATLSDVPVGIDVVDVFRRSEAVMPVAREAVEVGARVLWMQLGVTNGEAAAYATENGLTVVMDRCLKVEYAAKFGGIDGR